MEKTTTSSIGAKSTPTVTDPKSATITLHSGPSTLTLLATRRADGTATTTVTTRDADKKATRGMTESFSNMTEARAHLIMLAEKATKLGWARSTTGALKARPDAFSTLPKPPAAARPSK